MKKINLVLAAFLLLGVASVRAENSATGYSNPVNFRDQQVFVAAYNNSASTIAINNAVVLDSTGTAGSTLGAYINTSTTTDDPYIFGVADEAIAAGTVGRVCIRGPHKVVWTGPGKGGVTSGNVISNASTTAGTVGPTTTSSGTDRGILGKVINITATTDTGDASYTYWAWIQPEALN